MEGGPPMFKQDFTCLVLLEYLLGTLPLQGFHFLWHAFPNISSFRLQVYHLLWIVFPNNSPNYPSTTTGSYNPGLASKTGLGCSLFARRY